MRGKGEIPRKGGGGFDYILTQRREGKKKSVRSRKTSIHYIPDQSTRRGEKRRKEKKKRRGKKGEEGEERKKQARKPIRR